MASETRAAVSSQPRYNVVGAGSCSITAYGDGSRSVKPKESFKSRMARQHAIPLDGNTQMDLKMRHDSLVADSFLRRKTPSGTILQGYDASTNGSSSNVQPTKHLILHTLDPSDLPQTHSENLSSMQHAVERSNQLGNSSINPLNIGSEQFQASQFGFSGLSIYSDPPDMPRNTYPTGQDSWLFDPSQQTILPYGTYPPTNSLYYPVHGSPVQEPAMQAIDQRIDRLTLHDYTPPTASLRMHRFSNSVNGGISLYGPGTAEPQYRSRAYLPTFAQRVGFESHGFGPQNATHYVPYSWGAEQEIKKMSQQSFNSHGGYHNTMVNTSVKSPSYPHEVLHRAVTLYNSMLQTVRQLKEHSRNASDNQNSNAQSSHIFPVADCECHSTNQIPQHGLVQAVTPHTSQTDPIPLQSTSGSLNWGFNTLYPRDINIQDSNYVFDGSHNQPSLPLTPYDDAKLSAFVPPVDSATAIQNVTGRQTDSVLDITNSNYNMMALPPKSRVESRTTIAHGMLKELESLTYNGTQDVAVRAALIGGCIAFALRNYDLAATWFEKVTRRSTCHVAFSNLALTSLARKSYQDAEKYWQKSIDIWPASFDAAEHLIGLLCSQKRQQQAIKTIDHICSRLTSSSRQVRHPANHRIHVTLPLQAENLTRFLGLIHAKGNMQYGMQQYIDAARTFTEAVLLACGLRSGSLADLVHTVLARLSGQGLAFPNLGNEPLLLNPVQALKTVEVCFGHSGHLPGLHSVADMETRKSALSIISSSLLSLAKIFQDGMISQSKSSENLNAVFGVKEILALYYLSLSLQPSPSTANNVGILLAGIQQHSSEPAKTSQAKCGPNLAASFYWYGLTLDPKHAHLYTNFGSLLKDRGQLHEAISMYEKAVACDPSFDIALANLANAVKDQGKTEDAIIYYKRAVKANPNFVEAVCGLANALNSVCSWSGRGGAYIHDGVYDRWHVDENETLVDAQLVSAGSGWVQRVIDAVDKQLLDGESWGAGLTKSFLGPDAATGAASRLSKEITNRISSWHLKPWEGSYVVRLVERIIRQTMWRWYRDKYILRNEKSQSSYYRPQLPASSTNPSSPTVLPFHTFTLPLTGSQIRLISQRNGLRVSYGILRAPWLPSTVFPPPRPPAPQLNIGYVSSDFNNHPLAHLMQSVFGMHDQRRVKAYCYATTATDNSSHRKKIEAEAPVFYDASDWSVEKLVRQIVTDNIHILVNLNGYTRGARNEVFAARPAPIQMSFMGFAGSLGAEWCDYILADEIAAPASTLRPYRNNTSVEDLFRDGHHTGHSTSWVYSENVIFTRDSFFCCDHAQSAPPTERALTFADELTRRATLRRELFPDLPSDAIILANFNQLYKIDPTTFRTWLRILYRLPNAYLWLLRFPASGANNLQRLARSWASPAIASRILFTDVAPKHMHILRGCVADLFLDTAECNAHTTAADCVWSGTPLLTLPRYEWKMCSRMAAGILAGALPMDTDAGNQAWRELVVDSEDEYEETAVRLASSLLYSSDGIHAEGRLMDLRKLIWSNRWTCKLFDTRRWVRHVEIAYSEAWRKWVAAEGGDIWLKDLL